MATYVNNLRLKEIATGDESGTWGTSTNTNLELIGEALGFGTEAITTNADTHTTTVADGSADEGRAMYIKYTGTLDSACTITIGPNTLKRVHIIENATSGSQNIIISQGSGANVTIGPGNTKVVYLDGAGSGAAVVDAFASLAVVDLKVDDDLTLGSDSSIINMGADNDVTITHDGTTGVTIAANPITLDSGADIVLDADGADIVFKDAGTSILSITNSSTDVDFTVATQDKDIRFKGDDGGAGITALTLDMSDAGTAIFNHDIALADGAIIDCAGDLTIDVDGADLKLSDAGTQFGQITNSSTDFVIQSVVQDKDIIFKGDDGGSGIDALVLDMSDAGTAILNHDLELGTDGAIIKFGNDNEITLTHVADTGLLLEDSGGTPTLQLHDSNESIASDGSKVIITSGGTAFNLPTADGSNGQALTTNGSGTLAFTTISSGASLANDSNNRVATCTGSGGLNGESNFTWSGQNGIMNRNSDGGVLDFKRSNQAVGNVSVFSGACSFNNTSDYRAKNNIADMDEATSRLKQLQCKKFSMKADSNNTMRDGFIAHEVDPIVPQAVTGEKDAVDGEGNPDYQSIDTSQLVPLLVKTIQELEARITALES